MDTAIELFPIAAAQTASQKQRLAATDAGVAGNLDAEHAEHAEEQQNCEAKVACDALDGTQLKV